MNEQITVNLNNFTNEERELFTKLLRKASEEPSKESRAWKPKKIDQYYYINDFTDVCTDTWQEAGADYKRFKIGNVYKTREEAEIALERAKVTAELKRYALEHNETLRERWNKEGTYQHYNIVFDHAKNKIATTNAYFLQEGSATYFTSEEIAYNAIEAVGKDRILKYIFGIEVEE